MVYRTTADVDFTLNDVPRLPRPQRVLMTTPEYYDIEYVINPHMEGRIGSVDQAEAKRQWKRLRAAYEGLGIGVVTVPGQEGLVDMVFCANQTLPYHDPRTDQHGVVLSRMHAEQRRGEVPHFAHFFERRGDELVTLAEGLETDFEGMGDAIWHPGRYLLWGGYGIRTDVEAYDSISDALDVRVLALRLDDPDFYHLDTCFSVLDEHSALIFPAAFDDEGLGLIHHFFDEVIEAPEDEARQLFACNAHCPDEKHVIIQQGCTVTNERLREAGYVPVEVDTSEYLKAGGSVFCMKLMIWDA